MFFAPPPLYLCLIKLFSAVPLLPEENKRDRCRLRSRVLCAHYDLTFLNISDTNWAYLQISIKNSTWPNVAVVDAQHANQRPTVCVKLRSQQLERTISCMMRWWI
jgi:hypothetical protein